MRKPRIAIFTEEPSSTVSFYRCFGPLGPLRKLIDFDVVLLSEVTWATMSFCDILFCHRPSSADHFKVIQMARNMGKKVWVDHDDDLFNVPPTNPAYTYFKENIKYVAESIQAADVVTCPTEGIAMPPRQLNSQTFVIPNAIDEDVFNFYPPYDLREKRVVWRGSKTHGSDLYAFKDQIIKVMNNHPDWHIVFLGDNPLFITKELKCKWNWFEQLDILDYLGQLNHLKASVMIVPLEDNVFNRAKSSISWMEGTWYGAATVVPKWAEWIPKGMAAYQYQNPELFESIMETAMSYDNTEMVLEHRKHIVNNLTLDVVNKQRVEIIKSLIE